jgi:hypothetical protein
MQAQQNQATRNQTTMPSAETMQHAIRFALRDDKPIMMDYYMDSLTGKAFLGEYKGTTRRFLLKNEDEYTSDIQNIGRSGNEFICVTENSIYICSVNMKKKVVVR